jgi:hypothetical protein
MNDKQISRALIFEGAALRLQLYRFQDLRPRARKRFQKSTAWKILEIFEAREKAGERFFLSGVSRNAGV